MLAEVAGYRQFCKNYNRELNCDNGSEDDPKHRVYECRQYAMMMKAVIHKIKTEVATWGKAAERRVNYRYRHLDMRIIYDCARWE